MELIDCDRLIIFLHRYVMRPNFFHKAVIKAIAFTVRINEIYSCAIMCK